MENGIKIYQNKDLSLESYWRSIILFGRNVASYKFALGKALIELARENKSKIRLEELAEPFSRHICEHLEDAPKQITSPSSRFLDSCNNYNLGLIDKNELLETTYRLGFNNVIDAFHRVNREEIDVKFYEKDYESSKSIILTDDMFKLIEDQESKTLTNEVESRWNLVETAWELGINPNLLEVKYSEDLEELYIYMDQYERKDITSIRPALNGYQKGTCFYCNRNISIISGSDNLCDVDHFYPHILKAHLKGRANLDGVWNLVLSCKDCNRGVNGKFTSIAHEKYLKKLYNRNEYLILSHNPLRETLIKQTGRNNKERRSYLKSIDREVSNLLPSKNRWLAKAKGEDII